MANEITKKVRSDRPSISLKLVDKTVRWSIGD